MWQVRAAKVFAVLCLLGLASLSYCQAPVPPLPVPTPYSPPPVPSIRLAPVPDSVVDSVVRSGMVAPVSPEAVDRTVEGTVIVPVRMPAAAVSLPVLPPQPAWANRIEESIRKALEKATTGKVQAP